MPLLGQQVGGRQPGRPGADHEHVRMGHGANLDKQPGAATLRTAARSRCQRRFPTIPNARPTIGRKAEETLALPELRWEPVREPPVPRHASFTRALRPRRVGCTPARGRHVGTGFRTGLLPELAGACADGRPRRWRGALLATALPRRRHAGRARPVALRLAGRHRRRGAPRHRARAPRRRALVRHHAAPHRRARAARLALVAADRRCRSPC